MKLTPLLAAAVAFGAVALPGCADTANDLDDDSVDYTDDLADPEGVLQELDPLEDRERDPAFSSGGTDREFDGYEPLGEDVREAAEEIEREAEAPPDR